MTQPKKVLYFAENALSAIQGGGIVAYAVLKGLPADHLLGFFEYRNITPVPEYADRFVYLGRWRTPALFAAINRVTRRRSTSLLQRGFAERFIRKDLAFVEQEAERKGFRPEAVYFAGLSYRYLRLAVMAAERYDVPMVILHMDDWMEADLAQAGRWSALWARRIHRELTRAAARSLVSTTNSPRLASKLTSLTGHRHVPANNCCADLMPCAATPERRRPNRIPIITYAGAMNRHLQGETLKVLASAVAELNAEGTRVHLHIYTPWEFAPEANSVAVPHAVFYKGHVGREQLADIYRRADFLVTTVTYRDRNIPLFRHSLSTKLSEYLCTGKPVISMGHHDWHLHEYVQDHGCGFSILMDENFSRARIKEQLRRILAADPALLDRIGRSNRALWEKAHDVTVMARASRRALGLEAPDGQAAAASAMGRGVIWLGDPADGGWQPVSKAKAIARRLVDVFGHGAVDLIGGGIGAYGDLDALVTYCRDIGLTTTAVLEPRTAGDRDAGWEPAGARWSLAGTQRRPDVPLVEPLDVFAQVSALRGVATPAPMPVQRVINQLSVHVSESSPTRPTVWFYGSAVTGLEMIKAIEAHRWLSGAVEIGGFVSPAGHCKADILHGYAWRPADALLSERADLIVVASETSRLSIQEELSRLGLLDRMLPAFGTAAAAAVYEREPDGPGQSYVQGSSACDYATRELVARTMVESVETPVRSMPLVERRNPHQAAA
jgi:glycosyltransferase involved in cell wall biosynthesis